MAIIISKNHIENCGTGIKMTGKIDAELQDNVFKNNCNDIELFVSNISNVSINNNISFDCKTTSISVETYDETIDELILYANKKGNLNKDELECFSSLFSELKHNKDNPSKIKLILKEAYNISKSFFIPASIEYLKYKFGWNN